ncbi:HAMP domain-containing protein [Malonomonas rubra DSM 5091]|uniref:histidine kinase n=1 Tax=Malonomonas rubra DSM 5091 TaxID=1122189 RepID=A0A1M6CGT9_MALRU|nr:ATP-binding protein [Malonomonas rubra]SHI60227.1 HAMP domain-containing protein [Malonomonas rubra DSM 5091]
MSLKLKMILILSLISVVLGTAVWHEMSSAFRVEKKVNLFVPATGYLLGIAEVNTGLARQAKEAFDYLVTGDLTDRQEFNQLTEEVERGFELWIDSAQTQKLLGVQGDLISAGEAEELRKIYFRWVDYVLGSFDLIDMGQRSLALKQFEYGSWALLEQEIFSSIDAAMQNGFNDVEDAYHELLLAIGNRVWKPGDNSEILDTTHAAIHNVIAGCRVNSTSSRQFSALATYLLTGNRQSLQRYEELKVEVRGAINDWFLAAFDQSLGSEPQLSMSVSSVSKIVTSLDDLMRAEDEAVRIRQEGMPRKALLMMVQGSLENPLGDHLPLLVFSTLKSGSEELLMLASRASRQGVILLSIAFLFLLLLILRMSQKILLSLQLLKDGMDAVSRGDLQQQVALEGNDELAQLARHFNQMSNNLLASRQEVDELNAGLEQRVAERTRELAKANQELDAFNSAVSHDLRNPLSLITGYAEMMLAEESPPEVQEEYLKAIIYAGEKMDNIIGTLMDLSRMSSADLERSRVDMSALAQDIFERFKQREPNRKVEVSLAGNLSVDADFDMMTIVLENLLGNAWKYTNQTQLASIELGAASDREKSYFYVRDNGAGFDMKNADMLFKPFKRLHTQSEFDGTGVGLATVQRIIQCHGGDIWAESEVGSGSTFYFSFG